MTWSRDASAAAAKDRVHACSDQGTPRARSSNVISVIRKILVSLFWVSYVFPCNSVNFTIFGHLHV